MSKERSADGSITGLVLSDSQAIEIYKCKLQLLRPSSFESCMQSAESRIKGQSVPVAARFGVSPKTVRDIWNRRTWAFTTEKLWEEEDGFSVSESLDSVCYQAHMDLPCKNL
jgi:hypothetical protein